MWINDDKRWKTNVIQQYPTHMSLCVLKSKIYQNIYILKKNIKNIIVNRYLFDSFWHIGPLLIKHDQATVLQARLRHIVMPGKETKLCWSVPKPNLPSAIQRYSTAWLATYLSDFICIINLLFHSFQFPGHPWAIQTYSNQHANIQNHHRNS